MLRPALIAGAVGFTAWTPRLLRLRRQVPSYAAYWRDRAEQPGAFRYLALGDSVAQGIGASAPQHGYVGLLAERAAARLGVEVAVENLSRGGARVTDVLSEQAPLLAGRQADLVTLAIGGNDVAHYGEPTFVRALAELLDALPEGAFVADLPDFGGGPRLLRARRASALVRAYVANRPLRPVPLEQVTAARMRAFGSYAADWFHPSDRGHEVWADAFWREIEPTLTAD
ncbi:MAG: SGNH/GDSL hydrolase family protein [Egibacteraceae bacterium]